MCFINSDITYFTVDTMPCMLWMHEWKFLPFSLTSTITRCNSGRRHLARRGFHHNTITGDFGVYDFHLVLTTTTLEIIGRQNVDLFHIQKTLICNSQIFHLTRFSLDQAFSFTMRGFAGEVQLLLLWFRDVSAFLWIAARRSDETIVILRGFA